MVSANYTFNESLGCLKNIFYLWLLISWSKGSSAACCQYTLYIQCGYQLFSGYLEHAKVEGCQHNFVLAASSKSKYNVTKSIIFWIVAASLSTILPKYVIHHSTRTTTKCTTQTAGLWWNWLNDRPFWH